MSLSQLKTSKVSAWPEFRFWAVLATSVVLYGLASSIGNGWIFLLSSAFLVVLLGAFILPARALTIIEISESCPPRFTAGEKGQALLSIASRRSLFKPKWLTLRLAGEISRLEIDPDKHKVAIIESLERDTIVTLDFGELKRGIWEYPAVTVETCYPFGLLWFGCTKKTGETIIVQPKILKMETRFLNRLRSGSYVPGGNSHGQSGFASITTKNVREYIRGDSRRFIHWSLSARHNKLMVREFDQEGLPAFDVVLECSESFTSEKQFELAIVTAASLLGAGHKTGIHPALYILREPSSTLTDMPPYVVNDTEQMDALASLQFKRAPSRTPIKLTEPAIFGARSKGTILIQPAAAIDSPDNSFCPPNCFILEIGNQDTSTLANVQESAHKNRLRINSEDELHNL